MYHWVTDYLEKSDINFEIKIIIRAGEDKSYRDRKDARKERKRDKEIILIVKGLASLSNISNADLTIIALKISVNSSHEPEELCSSYEAGMEFEFASTWWCYFVIQDLWFKLIDYIKN